MEKLVLWFLYIFVFFFFFLEHRGFLSVFLVQMFLYSAQVIQ